MHAPLKQNIKPDNPLKMCWVQLPLALKSILAGSMIAKVKKQINHARKM